MLWEGPSSDRLIYDFFLGSLQLCCFVAFEWEKLERHEVPLKPDTHDDEVLYICISEIKGIHVYTFFQIKSWKTYTVLFLQVVSL